MSQTSDQAGTASPGACATAGRVSLRNIVPTTSAPASHRPPAHQYAVVRLPAPTELSSAVPIEPPICWEVLTIADATPASRGGMPWVAVANDGAIVSPKPMPIRISDGRTWVA